MCVCVIEFKLEQLSRTVNVADVKKETWQMRFWTSVWYTKFWKIPQWKTVNLILCQNSQNRNKCINKRIKLCKRNCVSCQQLNSSKDYITAYLCSFFFFLMKTIFIRSFYGYINRKLSIPVRIIKLYKYNEISCHSIETVSFFNVFNVNQHMRRHLIASGQGFLQG